MTNEHHSADLSAEDLRSALTRRSFLRTAAMTGLAAASATGVPGALYAQGASTMTWAKPLETTMLDPHTAILGSSWQMLHLVYDSLIDVDEELNPIPAIAESWEQESPTSYLFTIRSGVKFSNGADLTIADVVGSLKRVQDPATGSWWVRPMGMIDDVVAVGDNQVRVTLQEPHTPLIAALAATMCSILPMSLVESGELDVSKDMLGSGPYKIVSHEQDDNWVLERNPHYYQQGLPKIDRIVVKIVPSDNTRIAQLRDGSIDIASFEASPDAGLLLRGVANVEVNVEDVTNYYILGLNAVAEDSPFKDIKLRQAVALTLDRELIANIALGGGGQPTAVMAPAHKACDTSKLPLFGQDLDRARQLLAESGNEDLSFELLVRNIPADIQMAQVIAQGVAKIGLTANIAVVDEGIWVQRAWIDNPSKFEAMITWYAGYADPAISTLWWNPGVAGFTAGHVENNDDINAAIDAAYQTGGEARGAVLQNLCAKIDESANVIPLVTRQDTIAYRSDKLKAKLAHLEGYVHTLRNVETFELM
ncbi:ABC transport protein, solute binding component [Roseobacter sp. MED193]|uniref:ABC transporter substrate-binding protein n=1 Tax=Roseobacter sp. MED193 TaxID=314262 RepID=UPI000068A05F|nr:ABC transporter substrate-binding protein [Roseobacter sp. MED193]EAQ43974.1 ABC transport protein, solute binding component [Roseobacter sp. MED193]